MPSLSLNSPVVDLGAPCFDFGGTAVSITSDNDSFRELLIERYANFVTNAEARWQVHYRVTDPQAPPSELIRAAQRHEPIARRDGGRLHLDTPTYEIVLDKATEKVDISGALATYPVDRLIHTLCYESSDRALVLHAAALAEGDSGFLMSGPSGSGKSTIARLFPDRALCDEFVAVRMAEPSPRLSALPFWESRRGGAAVRGIYLLQHGRENRRRRVAPQEAIARLRQEVVWPILDQEHLRRAFETLFELVATVPVWELAFRPNVDVWEVIDS